MSESAGPTIQTLGAYTRRPAATVALLLIFGISLHDQTGINPHRILTACAIVAVLAALVIRYRHVASAGLAVLVVLIGMGLAQREHYQYSTSEIGLFASEEPRLAEVEVYVLDEPQILTAAVAGQRPMPPKQTVMGDVRRVKTGRGWTDASGRIAVAIEQPNPSLNAGQTVLLAGHAGAAEAGDESR